MHMRERTDISMFGPQPTSSSIDFDGFIICCNEFATILTATYVTFIQNLNVDNNTLQQSLLHNVRIVFYTSDDNMD